jgi:CDP-diacylglycerol--serine O-phosphatidyltransferase
MFVAFAFATCGALRLARFNVMSQRKVPGSSKFFTGLPIPLAAGMLISLVIAYHHAGLTTVQAPVPVAVLVSVLSLLMVSTIRYRTFKDVRLSKKSAMVFFAVIAAGIAVATQMRPSFVLVAYFSAYLLLGLAEEVLFFKKRRLEARAPPTPPSAPMAPPPATPADDEDDEEDSEEFV